MEAVVVTQNTVDWKVMARPNLLAVDDDVSVLEAVVQDLRRQYGAEYRVMRAASGQAALDTLDSIKGAPGAGGAAVERPAHARDDGGRVSWSGRERCIPRRNECC